MIFREKANEFGTRQTLHTRPLVHVCGIVCYYCCFHMEELCLPGRVSNVGFCDTWDRFHVVLVGFLTEQRNQAASLVPELGGP